MISVKTRQNDKETEINLTSVAASGTLNFFGPGKEPGHGWWYHKYLKLLPGKLKLDYSGLSSWIAKTTTLNERAGNMKINKKTLQPVKMFPDCVVLDFFNGIMLNAVGLSGFGLIDLFIRGEWQKIFQQFGISVIAIGKSPKERLEEIKDIAFFIRKELPKFQAPIFIEDNESCPNTGHDPCFREDSILERLEILSSIGVPVSVKLNALAKKETVRAIEQSKLCSWLSLGNTIPFGQLPDQIDWKRFFGTADPKFSPLAQYGGGGLSGWPLVEVYCNFIRELRDSGITLPILGGGGIGCCNSYWLKKEIQAYKYADADAIQFGSGFPLRPWLVKPAIELANEIFGRR